MGILYDVTFKIKTPGADSFMDIRYKHHATYEALETTLSDKKRFDVKYCNHGQYVKLRKFTPNMPHYQNRFLRSQTDKWAEYALYFFNYEPTTKEVRALTKVEKNRTTQTQQMRRLLQELTKF